MSPGLSLELIIRIMAVLICGSCWMHSARAKPSERRPVGSLNLLLAEDSVVNQKLAVALLERRIRSYAHP